MKAHGEFLSLFLPGPLLCFESIFLLTAPRRMNRRKADFKFAYKFLEDEI